MVPVVNYLLHHLDLVVNYQLILCVLLILLDLLALQVLLLPVNHHYLLDPQNHPDHLYLGLLDLLVLLDLDWQDLEVLFLADYPEVNYL